MCLLVCSFSWLPTDERIRQVKQLQRIASLKASMYWLSHFLADFAVYFVALGLMTGTVMVSPRIRMTCNCQFKAVKSNRI
jgi:hypothetical protein